MKSPFELRCIREHNGNDSLLYIENLPGAYARGETLAEAIEKLPGEAAAYLNWLGHPVPECFEPIIVQQQESSLEIRDADSDIIFDSERLPLAEAEYLHLKALALKSASDFHRLYMAVPDRTHSALPPRKTFYGAVPRTAEEMYLHTKNVNSYYFGEIGVQADNDGTIAECRIRGFESLERIPGFLEAPACEGSYDEYWSLRKLLRRFIWHDRIHARAMLRMARRSFGADSVPDIFCFNR